MKIIWSAQARAELRAIREFIARDSAHYADLTVQRIIERVERVAEAPTSGYRVHEYPTRWTYRTTRRLANVLPRGT